MKKPKEEPVVESIEKPADELVEELKENPVEELTEKQIEDSLVEPIEKPIEELVEESKEEPVGELIEKQIEELVVEPIEEPIEELVEESKEEPIGELIEKQIEESVAEPTEKPINELVEEPVEQSVAELTEKPIEEPTEKFIKKRKKIVLGIIISFCTLLVIYFGMTKYFMNHFYFGSKINSINVSGKTVDDAKIAIESGLQNYTLNLKEKDGKSEQIKASAVSLKTNSDEEVNKLKDSQSPFKWILALFTSKDSKMTIGLSYDENQLKDQMGKLSVFNSDNIVEPKNPSFQYKDNSYVIIDEVYGNKVDKDILYSQVVNSMLKGDSEIDLDSLGCYIKPQYNSKSEKALEIKDTLNKYVSSKITYTFGESRETVDGSTISKWINVDNNFQITFDIEKVKSYMYAISATYDTVGKTRRFTTSSGVTIDINGGDYGWCIDGEKEAENIIKDIEEGKTVTKEPLYLQTAFSNSNNASYSTNDIGNTYVEVDMSKQHLWFYKNGSLVVQGDVVTGNISSNHATPKGIYRLKYKERNAVLRGPGYAAPVNFWMPFNEDIGIHDATWRSSFGGGIYWTNGSHGCVNSPYYLANTIFNNIDPDTPVVCYY